MTLAIINRNIRTIKTAGAALNQRIQDTAVLCIAHAVETGDANPAMRLVSAVSPRLRNPLVLWFKTYSRINIAKKGDTLTCNLSKAEDRSDNLDGARANPWFDTAAAQKDDLPVDVMDFGKKVVSLIKFFEKKIDEGKVAGDVEVLRAKVAAIKAAA